MKSSRNDKCDKKVSKKVLGLFEGEFTLKVLNSSEKKRAAQKKVREFISNQVLKEPVVREVHPEKLRITEDLDLIPFIPTVHLTEDCLKNFFTTIASLNEKYKHIGLVKLRLPPGHKPERLSFTPENQKIEVRQQVLPFLPLGKPFVNMKDSYEFKEFVDYNTQQERKYSFSTPDCSVAGHKFLRDEREYWGIVHQKIKKPFTPPHDEFTVEYASDLPVDKYTDMEVGLNRTSSQFSLSGIFNMEDSLFQIIKNKTESISGIVIPWGYVAAKYSTFCWHTEDLFLYSLNYMHRGGCKIWYGVPYQDVEKVRAVLLEEYQEELKKRPGLLDEVTCMFSPVKFLQKGIKVHKVYQEEGDLILTLPGVYHGGFSPTCNICEAVNMAAVDWIPTALHQKEMNAREGFPRKSCFSLEWMIYESYLQRERLDFSPEAIQSLTCHFKSMAEKEIAARNRVRGQIVEEILILDKKIKFFEIQCFHCRHYTFLSWIGCRYCLRISCLNEPVCSCSDPARVLFLRCTDSELVNY